MPLITLQDKYTTPMWSQARKEITTALTTLEPQSFHYVLKAVSEAEKPLQCFRKYHSYAGYCLVGRSKKGSIQFQEDRTVSQSTLHFYRAIYFSTSLSWSHSPSQLQLRWRWETLCHLKFFSSLRQQKCLQTFSGDLPSYRQLSFESLFSETWRISPEARDWMNELLLIKVASWYYLYHLK